MTFFAFSIKLIWPGVGFLNRTGAEIGYRPCKKRYFLYLKKKKSLKYPALDFSLFWRMTCQFCAIVPNDFKGIVLFLKGRRGGRVYGVQRHDVRRLVPRLPPHRPGLGHARPAPRQQGADGLPPCPWPLSRSAARSFEDFFSHSLLFPNGFHPTSAFRRSYVKCVENLRFPQSDIKFMM